MQREHIKSIYIDHFTCNPNAYQFGIERHRIALY